MSRDRPDGVEVDACLGRREAVRHVFHGMREDDVGAICDALRRQPFWELDADQHLPLVPLGRAMCRHQRLARMFALRELTDEEARSFDNVFGDAVGQATHVEVDVRGRRVGQSQG